MEEKEKGKVKKFIEKNKKILAIAGGAAATVAGVFLVRKYVVKEDFYVTINVVDDIPGLEEEIAE